MRILQDDLVKLTQIGIERRRRLAARIRRERKARQAEITSGILTTTGIMTILGACFAAENISTRTMLVSTLIGFAMIAAAAVIDIINAQEGARWRKS